MYRKPDHHSSEVFSRRKGKLGLILNQRESRFAECRHLWESTLQ